MPRDSRVYLEDILDAIGAIRGYTSGLSRDGFDADRKIVDAGLRNLEVIGEAVKQMPSEIRVAHPEVEWTKIAGFRDVLVHGYFGIDLDIVWDVVAHKLPTFEEQVRAVLED